jgi:hypothetical protein
MIPKSGDFWQNVQFEVELVWALDQITLIFLLAPSAIYNFNEYVALGLGGQYTYLKQKLLCFPLLWWQYYRLFNPIPVIQL